MQFQNIDTYENNFCAFSGVFVGRSDIDEGGKVLLPSSMLAELSTMDLVYPLQFELQSYKGGKTHCGVLEFVAPEGQIILPQWMMRTLRIEPQDMIRVRTVALPKAKLVKLRPEEKAFIDLSNPKAVLESKLSQYSALSVGDQIAVHYMGRVYTIDIMKVVDRRTGQDCKAASILDTELEVDFDRPLDMPASPVKPPPSATPGGVFGGTAAVSSGAAASAGISFQPVKYAPPSLKDDDKDGKTKDGEPDDEQHFVPFAGSGKSLSGKAPPSTAAQSTASASAGPSNNNNKDGEKPSGEKHEEFHAFAGSGRSLSGKPAPPPPASSSASASATAEPPASDDHEKPKAAVPFAGTGRTLSGAPAKKPPTPQATASSSSSASASATPADAAAAKKEEEKKFAAFAGKGRSLR